LHSPHVFTPGYGLHRIVLPTFTSAALTTCLPTLVLPVPAFASFCFHVCVCSLTTHLPAVLCRSSPLRLQFSLDSCLPGFHCRVPRCLHTTFSSMHPHTVPLPYTWFCCAPHLSLPSFLCWDILVWPHCARGPVVPHTATAHTLSGLVGFWVLGLHATRLPHCCLLHCTAAPYHLTSTLTTCTVHSHALPLPLCTATATLHLCFGFFLLLWFVLATCTSPRVTCLLFPCCMHSCTYSPLPLHSFTPCTRLHATCLTALTWLHTLSCVCSSFHRYTLLHVLPTTPHRPGFTVPCTSPAFCWVSPFHTALSSGFPTPLHRLRLPVCPFLDCVARSALDFIVFLHLHTVLVSATGSLVHTPAVLRMGFHRHLCLLPHHGSHSPSAYHMPACTPLLLYTWLRRCHTPLTAHLCLHLAARHLCLSLCTHTAPRLPPITSGCLAVLTSGSHAVSCRHHSAGCLFVHLRLHSPRSGYALRATLVPLLPLVLPWFLPPLRPLRTPGFATLGSHCLPASAPHAPHGFPLTHIASFAGYLVFLQFTTTPRTLWLVGSVGFCVTVLHHTPTTGFAFSPPHCMRSGFHRSCTFSAYTCRLPRSATSPAPTAHCHRGSAPTCGLPGSQVGSLRFGLRFARSCTCTTRRCLGSLVAHHAPLPLHCLPATCAFRLIHLHASSRSPAPRSYTACCHTAPHLTPPATPVSLHLPLHTHPACVPRVLTPHPLVPTVAGYIQKISLHTLVYTVGTHWVHTLHTHTTSAFGLVYILPLYLVHYHYTPPAGSRCTCHTPLCLPLPAAHRTPATARTHTRYTLGSCIPFPRSLPGLHSVYYLWFTWFCTASHCPLTSHCTAPLPSATTFCLVWFAVYCLPLPTSTRVGLPPASALPLRVCTHLPTLLWFSLHLTASLPARFCLPPFLSHTALSHLHALRFTPHTHLHSSHTLAHCARFTRVYTPPRGSATYTHCFTVLHHHGSHLPPFTTGSATSATTTSLPHHHALPFVRSPRSHTSYVWSLVCDFPSLRSRFVHVPRAHLCRFLCGSTARFTCTTTFGSSHVPRFTHLQFSSFTGSFRWFARFYFLDFTPPLHRLLRSRSSLTARSRLHLLHRTHHLYTPRLHHVRFSAVLLCTHCHCTLPHLCTLTVYTPGFATTHWFLLPPLTGYTAHYTRTLPHPTHTRLRFSTTHTPLHTCTHHHLPPHCTFFTCTSFWVLHLHFPSPSPALGLPLHVLGSGFTHLFTFTTTRFLCSSHHLTLHSLHHCTTPARFPHTTATLVPLVHTHVSPHWFSLFLFLHGYTTTVCLGSPHHTLPLPTAFTLVHVALHSVSPHLTCTPPHVLGLVLPALCTVPTTRFTSFGLGSHTTTTRFTYPLCTHTHCDPGLFYHLHTSRYYTRSLRFTYGSIPAVHTLHGCVLPPRSHVHVHTRFCTFVLTTTLWIHRTFSSHSATHVRSAFVRLFTVRSQLVGSATFLVCSQFCHLSARLPLLPHTLSHSHLRSPHLPAPGFTTPLCTHCTAHLTATHTAYTLFFTPPATHPHTPLVYTHVSTHHTLQFTCLPPAHTHWVTFLTHTFSWVHGFHTWVWLPLWIWIPSFVWISFEHTWFTVHTRSGFVPLDLLPPHTFTTCRVPGYRRSFYGCHCHRSLHYVCPRLGSRFAHTRAARAHFTLTPALPHSFHLPATPASFYGLPPLPHYGSLTVCVFVWLHVYVRFTRVFSSVHVFGSAHTRLPPLHLPPLHLFTALTPHTVGLFSFLHFTYTVPLFCSLTGFTTFATPHTAASFTHYTTTFTVYHVPLVPFSPPRTSRFSHHRALDSRLRSFGFTLHHTPPHWVLWVTVPFLRLPHHYVHLPFTHFALLHLSAFVRLYVCMVKTAGSSPPPLPFWFTFYVYAPFVHAVPGFHVCVSPPSFTTLPPHTTASPHSPPRSLPFLVLHVHVLPPMDLPRSHFAAYFTSTLSSTARRSFTFCTLRRTTSHYTTCTRGLRSSCTHTVLPHARFTACCAFAAYLPTTTPHAPAHTAVLPPYVGLPARATHCTCLVLSPPHCYLCTALRTAVLHTHCLDPTAAPLPARTGFILRILHTYRCAPRFCALLSIWFCTRTAHCRRTRVFFRLVVRTATHYTHTGYTAARWFTSWFTHCMRLRTTHCTALHTIVTTLHCMRSRLSHLPSFTRFTPCAHTGSWFTSWFTPAHRTPHTFGFTPHHVTRLVYTRFTLTLHCLTTHLHTQLHTLHTTVTAPHWIHTVHVWIHSASGLHLHTSHHVHRFWVAVHYLVLRCYLLLHTGFTAPSARLVLHALCTRTWFAVHIFCLPGSGLHCYVWFLPAFSLRFTALPVATNYHFSGFSAPFTTSFGYLSFTHHHCTAPALYTPVCTARLLLHHLTTTSLDLDLPHTTFTFGPYVCVPVHVRSYVYV